MSWLKKNSKASGNSDPASTKEHFGIKVYPGAKFDDEVTKFSGEALSTDDIYCYRTSDSVEKVVAFYEKLGSLDLLGADATSAVFTKDENGNSIKIGITNPWTDGKTGQSNFDTLIQFLKMPE